MGTKRKPTGDVIDMEARRDSAAALAATRVLAKFTEAVSRDIANMRSDIAALSDRNDRQHNENKSESDKNFQTIHARLSTLASNQANNREELLKKVADVATASEARDKAINDERDDWKFKALKYALMGLGALCIALLSAKFKIDIPWPFF